MNLERDAEGWLKQSPQEIQFRGLSAKLLDERAQAICAAAGRNGMTHRAGEYLTMIERLRSYAPA